MSRLQRPSGDTAAAGPGDRAAPPAPVPEPPASAPPATGAREPPANTPPPAGAGAGGGIAEGAAAGAAGPAPAGGAERTATGAAGSAAAFLPVFRPQLPPTAALLPYLQQIDAARIYTNRGPLLWGFEQRLAGLLDLPPHGVRTAASGTLALELAILAHAGRARPDRPLALLPAMTFAATAQAAERCGYRPVFVDVDPARWTLEAAALHDDPRLARAGLVVPVAPYGRLPDLAALAALQAATGVPVVVDAAAAFEQLLDAPARLPDGLPLALSFHATKAFATGEGGAVIWCCREGQARVVQIANFGFRNAREAQTVGLNGKLSEYHAAVGHAMLDDLPARRAAHARVAGQYAALAAGRDPGGVLHLPPAISPAYVLLETAGPEGFARAEAALTARGIETRRWYGRGVHVQPYFAATAGGDAPPALPVTEALCARLMGLPMAPDLAPAQVARVLDALAAAHPARPEGAAP